ncbi:MAG: hypothetical protein WA594_16305, partial [Candidatus Sulfotelmatobacter sp.]
VHLVYTFWGPNLTPRDPALQISMSQISPVITKETSMWRTWVGFNASHHSMGLILFGLVFGYLALAHSQLLFQSPFLLAVGLAVLVGFVVLCKLYFFRAPLIGISISLACFVASIALSRSLRSWQCVETPWSVNLSLRSPEQTCRPAYPRPFQALQWQL